VGLPDDASIQAIISTTPSSSSDAAIMRGGEDFEARYWRLARSELPESRTRDLTSGCRRESWMDWLTPQLAPPAP